MYIGGVFNFWRSVLMFNDLNNIEEKAFKTYINSLFVNDMQNKKLI